MRMLNSSFPFLVNVKHHLEAWNMNYSVFGRFQWIRMNANILEMMLRKTEEKRDCFRPGGWPLNLLCDFTFTNMAFTATFSWCVAP